MMSAPSFTSPKRLVPRIGFIEVPDPRGLGLVGADLEEIAAQPVRVGHELDAPFRLELAVAGVDLGGEDFGQGVPAQPPSPKLEWPPSMMNPAPFRTASTSRRCCVGVR